MSQVVFSYRPLSKFETYRITHAYNAISIDKFFSDGNNIINVKNVCIVEYEKDGEKYTIMYIVDTDGNMYATSGSAFINSMDEIIDVVKDEYKDNDDPFPPFAITIIKRNSKKNAGRVYYQATL